MFVVLGGIGEAICAAVSIKGSIKVERLAVNEVPRSGPPKILLEKYGIDSGHIVEAVKEIIRG